uniref:Cytoskeleton-associated protein 2 n=1 Tax=Pogona vitticeps TaxID=103695 RepID=A0A6J0T9N4_9SAUR
MEDKENAHGCTWNQTDTTLEQNVASPNISKSPTVLKQISAVTNCNPLSSSTAIISKSSETKTKNMSFNQTLLLKQNTKEKQLKTPALNSGACLSERRVLGSYRGKIVSSKINSFRKTMENQGSRNSWAVPPKSAGKMGSISGSAGDAKVTSTGCPSKPAGSTSQIKPTVRVSVSNPKPILSYEKQSATSVNKAAAQRKPDKSSKPLLVPSCANISAHKPKKPLLPKSGTGSLLEPVSDPHGTVSASKPLDHRKTALAKSAEMRRSQVAERRASKMIKKPPASVSADRRPETETLQQNTNKRVESFWAAIAEEDEQSLVNDGVKKTLAECLSLIEKGFPGDTVHSTLEKLILKVPDAKKLAKYWVCQMRLEQCRSIEKVLSIYENAILAGAQPKDELRHALVDAMKSTRNETKSDEECLKNNITQNHEAEVNKDEVKIGKALNKVSFEKIVNSNNEEASQKATETCVESEQGGFQPEKKLRNEHSRKSTVLKKEEQSVGNEEEILAFKTPENVKRGSYIKYNLSTTPYLESAKKKLQSETNNSAVKDLKFLTPVRRSRRIQDKESKLPNILKDHNLCVSSLEQLGELGDDGIAFIYRQNSAL